MQVTFHSSPVVIDTVSNVVNPQYMNDEMAASKSVSRRARFDNHSLSGKFLKPSEKTLRMKSTAAGALVSCDRV